MRGDAGIEPEGGELGARAFGRERGTLGVDHLEVGNEAGLLTAGGGVGGSGGFPGGEVGGVAERGGGGDGRTRVVGADTRQRGEGGRGGGEEDERYFHVRCGRHGPTQACCDAATGDAGAVLRRPSFSRTT